MWLPNQSAARLVTELPANYRSRRGWVTKPPQDPLPAPCLGFEGGWGEDERCQVGDHCEYVNDVY